MTAHSWQRILWLISASLILSGCALTAEQRAAYAAERERERLQTELALAARCDPELARLAALRHEGYPDLSEAQRRQAENDYNQRSTQPAFQACYRMAWENLRYQQRLDALERREMRRELEWMMYRPFYRHR